MPTLTESAPSLSTLDLIVRRAGTLYTLPAVAVEMLELIDDPKSDVPALRECLQQDPALTAKVLRVVNSSLFGLSHSVGDLNEAVTLLGIRQLKLLVLGFSLPEQLFLGIAGEQLEWYWNATLARAVAAREVSERLFRRPGDEAFLAGLLQDLGVLVLLRELGGPYAALVREAMTNRAELAALEQTALGFDHIQLTAGLLTHWKMPQSLVRAISEPRNAKRLAKSRDEYAPLSRVLHLAELLAQLVGQHRLSVLPDLLEAGREYCDLDKALLNDVVAALEPKVRQLGEVLSINATSASEYATVLMRAHEAMSRVAESIAGPRSKDVDRRSHLVDELRKTNPPNGTVSLQEVHAAVERFLEAPPKKRDTIATAAAILAAGAASPNDVKSVRPSWSRDELANPPAAAAATPPAAPADFGGLQTQDFQVRLTLAVGQARANRQPLSVVALAIESATPLEPYNVKTVDRLVEVACRGVDAVRDCEDSNLGAHRVLLLPGRDRQDAVAVARALVERLQTLIAPLQRAGQLTTCMVAAGVGSAFEPAKSFQSERLLETAKRCLTAALKGGGVKSLEVI